MAFKPLRDGVRLLRAGNRDPPVKT